MAKASPVPLLGIDHVVIRVRDLEPMLTFYTDVLGCQVAKHKAPLDLWHLRAGSALIDLVPVNGVLGRGGGASGDTEPPAASGRHVDHVAFKVQPFDVAALLSHLKAHALMPKPPCKAVLAPKAMAHRFSSAIPRAMGLNSRAIE